MVIVIDLYYCLLCTLLRSQGDRRFYTEVKEGLRPAGETLLTNESVPPL